MDIDPRGFVALNSDINLVLINILGMTHNGYDGKYYAQVGSYVKVLGHGDNLYPSLSDVVVAEKPSRRRLLIKDFDLFLGITCENHFRIDCNPYNRYSKLFCFDIENTQRSLYSRGFGAYPSLALFNALLDYGKKNPHLFVEGQDGKS